jgi:hypothetical protein
MPSSGIWKSNCTLQQTLRLRYRAQLVKLCKICGFHGGDYEECHLLGYKNPIRTLQETLRLRYRAQSVKLCKIWDFHGGDWRIPSSGMWPRVALVSTDVSKEGITSIIRMTRTSELGTLAVTNNWSRLRIQEVLRSHLHLDTAYLHRGSRGCSCSSRQTLGYSPALRNGNASQLLFRLSLYHSKLYNSDKDRPALPRTIPSCVSPQSQGHSVPLLHSHSLPDKHSPILMRLFIARLISSTLKMEAAGFYATLISEYTSSRSRRP